MDQSAHSEGRDGLIAGVCDSYGGQMGETVEEWLTNSPKDLAPALKYLQKKFKRAHWGFGQPTRHFCYTSLHGTAVDDPRGEYVAYLSFMHLRLGLQPKVRFDGYIREGTPSAIFKAYYDLYVGSLEVEILLIFKELLDVGLASQRRLDKSPIEWAKAQAKFLIGHEGHMVRIWIRDVCDEHVYDPTDPEEGIFWRRWQAPSFLLMTPSKFERFDPARVWERNDPATSSAWLHAFEEDYVLRLESRIETAAGHSTVEWAKEHGIVETAVRVAGPLKTEPINTVLKPSASRQQSRKLATQRRYRKWQTEYRRLVKRRPNMSDVWYSQQIAKMDIADGSSPETIRKHMRP
jgi:hypothetical protein